jgi:hypothetical protein
MLPYTAIDGLSAMRDAYDLPPTPAEIRGLGRRWTRQRVRSAVIAVAPWLTALALGS